MQSGSIVKNGLVKLTWSAISAMAALAQTGERMGGVSGVIRAPDGTPVAGVTVGYLRLPPFNRSAGQKISARTGADGSFQLTGMAAGSYTICVQALPDAGWLDPCLWSDPPEAVHLPPGLLMTGRTITLKRATTLEVRVADPGRFLEDNEGKRPQGYAIFGVWTPARIFVPAHKATGNPTSRVYQMAVPQATPLRVGVVSSLYQMRGEGGAEVVGGVVRDNLTIPAGTARSTVNVTIAGLAARPR